MAGNLEVTLSWLDDELLALTNAEKEMGENGIYKSADTTTKKQSETESTAEELISRLQDVEIQGPPYMVLGNVFVLEPLERNDNPLFAPSISAYSSLARYRGSLPYFYCDQVTHSTELPKKQKAKIYSAKTPVELEPEKKPEPKESSVSENSIQAQNTKTSLFPTLDLGIDDSILPSYDTDMAQRSTSKPLGAASDAKSQEDELEFYTKSLIDKMNSPGDKDMYGYCGRCNGIVEGEKTGCTAMDKIFHIDCFRCKTCDRLLHGSQFYVVEKETYCESCYMNSLEKCTVCSEILRATGKPYHPACFKCVECGKCLDGVPFTVDVTNQIHCVDDFHKKFAPKCSVCSEPIMPEVGQEETVRIVALDRSFHVRCYRCEKCGTKLSSEDEGKGCFPLDGRILCRDCNTAMVQELSRKIS